MRSIALIVRADASAIELSPFFAKAGGLLLVAPDTGDEVYVPNRDGTSDWMCEEILRRRVGRVISGFIGPPAVQRLADAGVDVRLGPCSVPAESLIGRFEELPKAAGDSACGGVTRRGAVAPDSPRTPGPTSESGKSRRRCRRAGASDSCRHG